MKNWKKLNLKLKLVIGFSITSLIGLSALGALSIYFASHVVQDQAIANLHEQIQGIETSIKLSYDENLQRRTQEMDHWGPEILAKISYKLGAPSETEVVNQTNQEKVKVMVPSLLFEGRPIEDNQLADSLSKTTSDSVTFFANTDKGLVRVSTSVRKQDGKRATGTMIPKDSAVYKALAQGQRYVGRAKVLDKWFISAYEPILENRQLVGAFFMGSPDLSYLKIKDYLKSKKLLDTGYFFILDGKGDFALHPSREGESALAATDLDGQKIFQDILEKKSGTIEYRWKNAQTNLPQEKLALFKYVAEYDWYISASVNKAEVLASLKPLKMTILITTLLAIIGMSTVSFFFGHSLAGHLQTMSQSLREITGSTEESAQALSRSSIELSSVSTESAASLEETVASLEEITSQVQNNNKVSEETNQIGRETLTTARVSREQMTALLQAMQTIQTESKRIQSMSDIIDDIAFQTNLLALNAAVEAARAGDHGRGFAVVAEAVRSLALKSAEAAKQISGVMSENNARVNDSVEAVQKADRSFQNIVENIEKLSALVAKISEASAEQSIGLTQINTAMNQMDQAVQMNASSAESLSTGSAKLSEQSEQLSGAVIELSQLINGEKETGSKIAA